MTVEQLAARLSGGYVWSAYDKTLRNVIQEVLLGTSLGVVDKYIDSSRYMAHAAVDTLRKTWRANLDLQSCTGKYPRLVSIACFEMAVLMLTALPLAMAKPADLAEVEMKHVNHIFAIFGSSKIVGSTEMSLCWRLLLLVSGKVISNNVRCYCQNVGNVDRESQHG